MPFIETLEQLGYWREIYNRAEHLIKNWKMGIYSIAPILKGHKGKITAFDSDGLYLYFYLILSYKTHYKWVLYKNNT